MTVKSTWVDGESVNAAAMNAVATDLNASTAVTSAIDEKIQDVIGTKVIQGTGVTVAYDDASGNTTISATATGGGMTDPTTTKGDLIARTTTASTRVPVGTNNQVLTADSAQTTGVKWATPASGFADPLTTKGDLITRGTVTGRKAVGTNGQVLAADSAQTDGIGWKTLAKADVGLGSVDNTADASKPVSTAQAAADTAVANAAVAKSTVTAKGALLAATAAATVAQVTVGTNGQVLTADSSQATGVAWANSPAGFANPLTNKGDIIVRTATTTVRLPVGTNGQVLTANSALTNGLGWAAAGGGGGGSSSLVNVVDDFGADPSGSVSSGNAFRAAAAAGPVFVPAGNYIFDGAPISVARPTFIGMGPVNTVIYPAAGQYFLDSTAAFDSLLLRDLGFDGGLGAVRSTYTGPAVAEYRIIDNCMFNNYTQCAVGHRNVDSPYWIFNNCVFQAASFTNTIGIAMNGLTDSVNIIGCDFHVNGVHVKLYNGANAHIHRSAFLRFATHAGISAIDVWLVPSPDWEADIGTGFTCKDNKFGNEFLESQDWRILIADESATGTGFEQKRPSFAASTGWLFGPMIKDNIQNSLAGIAPPLVYTTIPAGQFIFSWIGPNEQGGDTPAFLRFLNGTGFDGSLHVVGPTMNGLSSMTAQPTLVTAASGTLGTQPVDALGN